VAAEDSVAPFNQLSLTRRSDAYWRVTFNRPPINLFDDNTVHPVAHAWMFLEGRLARTPPPW
jgi:hypothetical protein